MRARDPVPDLGGGIHAGVRGVRVDLLQGHDLGADALQGLPVRERLVRRRQALRADDDVVERIAGPVRRRRGRVGREGLRVRHVAGHRGAGRARRGHRARRPRRGLLGAHAHLDGGVKEELPGGRHVLERRHDDGRDGVAAPGADPGQPDNLPRVRQRRAVCLGVSLGNLCRLFGRECGRPGRGSDREAAGQTHGAAVLEVQHGRRGARGKEEVHGHCREHGRSRLAGEVGALERDEIGAVVLLERELRRVERQGLRRGDRGRAESMDHENERDDPDPSPSARRHFTLLHRAPPPFRLRRRTKKGL